MKKLVLVDPNTLLCLEWQKSFVNHPEVEIVNDYFENLDSFDCIVSAANSFGLMDGGVDLAIIKFFGKTLETRVQQMIIKKYRGEQPVGTSEIVQTDSEKYPYIAHTPTMRVPLKITRTDNVYNAMFAMLRSVADFNAISEKKIQIVACPGLGTATGKLSSKEASRQMELAYKNFKSPPAQIDWNYAMKRQGEIFYGGDLFS